MFISNTLALTLERIVRLILGFLYVILAARFLDVHEFSLLIFSQTIIVLLNSLASFGIEAQLPQLLVRRTDRRKVLLVALLPRLALGLCAAIMVVLGCILLSPPETTILVILAPILLFGSHQVFEQVMIFARLHFRLSALKISTGLIFFLIKLAAVVYTKDVNLIAATILLESIFLFSITFIFSIKIVGGSFMPFPKFRAVRIFIWRSVPLGIAISTLQLFAYSDQILLRWFHGGTVIGEYALGVRITEAWMATIGAFALAITPDIVRDYDANRGRLQDARLFRMSMEIAIFGSCFFTALCWIFAPTILKFLVGQKLEGAIEIAQVYSLIAPLAAMRLVSGKWFVAQKLNQVLAQRAAAGLVINILVGIALIPSLGGIGAATSTIVAYLFVGFLADLFHSQSKAMINIKILSTLPMETINYAAKKFRTKE